MESRIPVRAASLAEQVLEILIERIRQGQYPPEAQLPPENQLATEFNVSRATVRSAIETLAARGLVVRRQGVGTFVSRLSRLANPLNEAMDFAELITRSGYAPGYRFVRTEIGPAGPRIAQALDIATGDLVLQTYKVFTADDEPVIYAVNHLAVALLGEDLAGQVAANPNLTEPLFDFLEQQCGQHVDYCIASVRAELAADMPFPDLAGEQPVPVLIIDEVGYGRERPIWHSYEYFPGNLMNFELVRQRGPFSRVGK